jgi:hypothetical protein
MTADDFHRVASGHPDVHEHILQKAFERLRRVGDANAAMAARATDIMRASEVMRLSTRRMSDPPQEIQERLTGRLTDHCCRRMSESPSSSTDAAKRQGDLPHADAQLAGALQA